MVKAEGSLGNRDVVSMSLKTENDQLTEKRTFIIEELAQTEAEYVADLTVLVQEFLPRISQEFSLKNTTIAAEIFQNIDEILSVHQKFLHDLQAKIQSAKKSFKEVQLGDILVGFSSSLKPYLTYCPYHIYAMATLELEIKRNRDFCSALMILEKMPACRKLPLASFLGRPLTRIPRYILLLKNILNTYSDRSIREARLIQDAVTTITEVLKKIDSETGLVTNSFYLNELQSKLILKPSQNDLAEVSFLFVENIYLHLFLEFATL